MARSILFVALALSSLGLPGRAQTVDCNAPVSGKQITVALPGHPFKIATTPDGCWVFAAMLGAEPGRAVGGLAVLKRLNGKLEVVRTVEQKGGMGGLVLTHDRKALVATSGNGVVVMDVERLLGKGKDDPVIASIEEGGRAAIYVNVTSDDKLLFVSDEGSASITVIDMAKARSVKAAGQAIIGKIPTGNAPIGLAFSPDGRWLYTTSQHALPAWGWPQVCEPEFVPPGRPVNKGPEGAVIVVDVAKAATDPAQAVAARVPAGCVPVRLALSPTGDRAYVTARKSNAVMVFDTESRKIIGTVPVGTAPVPVAVIDGGKKVIAGNSNRFGTDGDPRQTLTVLDAGKISQGADAVIGTITCGVFPRDLVTSPDGKTLFVANYMSNSLQVMNVANLPIEPKPAAR
jgi:YVTN family beta-propeller protein